MKINFKAYVAWIAICIIWGTTYLAIKVGVTELPPMLFAGIRWIVAGFILIILLNLSGKTLPRFKDLKHIAIVGISLIGIGNGLVVVAEQWISSGLAALLLSTLPFWMVASESILAKGPKVNIYIAAGLIAGTIGVMILFSRDLDIFVDVNLLIGVICLMAAEIAWALGSIYSKYVKVNVHPLMNASFQMLIAGILQTALGFILGEFSEFYMNMNGLLSMAYLILFGSIIGYPAYIYAIEHLPLSLVSTYAYINPIIALILGWYILDEVLTIYVLISAVLIIFGVILVKKGSSVEMKKIQSP
ncbi:MAG TPA: EamA family transporter [Ignavibacteriaceae bacterium]